MSAQRTAIFNNLRTTLASIVAGGTIASFPPFGTILFKSTVRTVAVVDRAWVPTAIAPDSTPMVVVQPMLDHADPQPGGQYYRNWQCILMCFVDGYADDVPGRTAAMDALEDDIIAAISADTTRGGNAIRTTVMDTDPEYLAGTTLGGLKILVDVRYQRSVASS